MDKGIITGMWQKVTISKRGDTCEIGEHQKPSDAFWLKIEQSVARIAFHDGNAVADLAAQLSFADAAVAQINIGNITLDALLSRLQEVVYYHMDYSLQ